MKEPRWRDPGGVFRYEAPPMLEKTFRWLPHGHPIPPGWRLAAQALSHHTAHAVLVEPDPDNPVAAYAAEVQALRSAATLGD